MRGCSIATTRGAALTEAGASFREHAVRIAAEADAARDAVSPDGKVRGRLRVRRRCPSALSTSRRCWPNSPAGTRTRDPGLVQRSHVSTWSRKDSMRRSGSACSTTRSSSRAASRTFGGDLVASPAYLERRPPRTPDDLLAHAPSTASTTHGRCCTTAA
jgi:DNA-binding transcriptional LysR family regulator